MKARGKVKIEWSPNFAYAIGLIASDGYLSNNKRHIIFTTKDLELAKHFKICLNLDNKIGKKARGGEKEKKYFVVQFGDVLFYNFLNKIGLHTNKSKTIESVEVPDKYFIDYLRGCFDGDGGFSIYKHPESKYRQFRIKISSASIKYLLWTKKKIKELYGINTGWIEPFGNNRAAALVYGIKDTVILCELMYGSNSLFLSRKFNIYRKLKKGVNKKIVF